MNPPNVPDNLPVRTQFMIFTLFGDFILPETDRIWTGSLLHLMGLLDVSERAVRSTLSRMSRKGWIRSQKHGRRSMYILTPRGRALLEAGQARIFEPPLDNWNGRWYLVVYSLPEKRRRKRHALRKQLTWLGFGNLAPGTWISPHDRNASLAGLFEEMGVEKFVEQFAGKHLGPSETASLITRCWDLESLEKQYGDFIERYRSGYADALHRSQNGNPLNSGDCFVRRFWLTHEFTSIPNMDPNLPPELLPEEWAGFQARSLLNAYRSLLEAPAFEYVREVMNGGNGSP